MMVASGVNAGGALGGKFHCLSASRRLGRSLPLLPSGAGPERFEPRLRGTPRKRRRRRRAPPRLALPRTRRIVLIGLRGGSFWRRGPVSFRMARPSSHICPAFALLGGRLWSQTGGAKSLERFWGHVPRCGAPDQAARDGEDFSDLLRVWHALVSLGVNPHIDCSGTIGLARDSGSAACPDNPLSHIWLHVLDKLGGVISHKVPARRSARDVLDGTSRRLQL